MRTFTKFFAVALMGLGLSACGGGGYDAAYQDRYENRAPVVTGALPPMTGSSRAESMANGKPLQCVPYVREHSAIKIYGDAWTWWDKAAGQYERGASPAPGAVLVLHDYAGPDHGHVAVVKRLVSPREIRIDHANWLNDGAIYVNNPVRDVSAANDWSQVRVYNIQTGGWGAKVYPVKGFIGSGSSMPRVPAPEPDDAPDDDRPLSEDAPLLAQAKPAPGAAPVRAAARPGSDMMAMSVSATTAELGPPPGSPFALTADDLAIP